MVSAPGQLEWVLGGGEGAELSRVLPPQLRRGVALIPGPEVRAVELTSGRVLASLALDGSLIDWAVDARLGLHLLESTGRLRSLSLSGAVSVV